VDTVKKCLAGAIETTIGMKAFEGVSSYLPRTISGRYLMMRNVMLCAQKLDGKKIGKTEEECLKVHILKGSSIEYMTKRFGERVSANPQVWFRYAAGNGHLEMVQHLVEQFELTADDARTWDNYALRCAAENGHLEMVQYLVDRFKLTAEDITAHNHAILRTAIKKQNQPLLHFLRTRFNMTEADLYFASAAYE
jgi:hypothetical protein